MCVPARFSLRLKLSSSLSHSLLAPSPSSLALVSRLISSLPSFRKWSEAFVAVWLCPFFPPTTLFSHLARVNPSVLRSPSSATFVSSSLRLIFPRPGKLLRLHSCSIASVTTSQIPNTKASLSGTRRQTNFDYDPTQRCQKSCRVASSFYLFICFISGRTACN
ncbi:hypothetical protein F5Y08DRAFT_271435 [Xylaria arbuscula]|nr:hypothetical protein F5Y08DRAFT_271435 [Xylaria arbuscula]